MGTGGEGGTTTARPKTRLNRTRGFPLCYFFSLSGLYSLETPSGSTIAGHTIQQPRRQKATSHHGTPRWSLITSEIPALNTIPQLALGGDMSNSPTFCLSHYLYHSALTHLFE